MNVFTSAIAVLAFAASMVAGATAEAETWSVRFIEPTVAKLFKPTITGMPGHPIEDTQPHSLFDNFDEGHHNLDGHKGDDIRYFPDMLASMDKLIGKVVDKLAEHKLREKTLIVVMGDSC